MRAEAAGDPGPWRQQAVLGRSRWDADALRDLVRDYALGPWRCRMPCGRRRDRLLKQGPLLRVRGNTPARQARSPTARSACSPPTCPIAATPSSIASLPAPELGRPAGCRRAAHVPDDVHFATKPAIAVAMLGGRSRRACRSPGLPPAASTAWRGRDGPAPAARATCSGSPARARSGPGARRRWPARRRDRPRLAASAWVRLSAGDGTKGPRLYGWAYLELRLEPGGRLPRARHLDAWPARPAQPQPCAWPTSPPGARRHPARGAVGVEVGAGRSRTRSRPPNRARSPQRDPQLHAGTATSRW